MLAEFIQLPKPGSHLGPFVLEAVLSSSILGNFYHAKNRLTGDSSLIFILPEALLKADSRFQKRFADSVAKQNGLAEDSVLLSVGEISVEDGNLVVNYGSGEYRSVTDHVLKVDAPLSERAVIGRLKELVRGLSDGEKLGIGHHFLTPDFLFIGADDRLRIAGAGIFQSMAYEAFERYVSGAVMPLIVEKERSFSAIEILSPEIRNFKARDPRSDFYCIGMCAYFMLTRQKPKRNWILPSAAREGINAEWDRILSRCLEPNPAARYPHYRALEAELEVLAQERVCGPKGQSKRGRILAKIPLPKVLEQRLGVRALVWTRIGLLVLAGALALLTAHLLRYILLADLTEASEQRRITRVDRPEGANLVFSMVPAETVLRIRSESGGIALAQGYRAFFLAARDLYAVEAIAQGYHPVSFRLRVEGSERIERQIRLRPAFVVVTFEGLPGTRISAGLVDGFELPVAELPEAGVLQLAERFLAGSHRWIARHPHADPVQVDAELQSDPLQIRFAQQLFAASLQLASEPAGAAVFMDGVKVGQTPARIVGIRPRKSMDLRLELDGYHSYAGQILLEPAEEHAVEEPIVLRRRMGEVSLQLMWPAASPMNLSALTIEVGDFNWSLDQIGRETRKLPTGATRFRLLHPDYLPVENEFAVLEDQITRLEVEMRPRKARLLPLLPADAVYLFRVNGQDFSADTENGLLLDPYTDYVVDVIVRDYQPVRRQFNPQANETIEWDVPLIPLPGPVKGSPWTVPYSDLSFVWIESGGFMLGSPVTENRRLPNEDSRTFVRITEPFWAAAHEVGQEDFRRLMGFNPSIFDEAGHPVDSVSWRQAVEFCRRLTEYERQVGRLPDGYVYRLPSEAEWEYMARAGTGTAYWFGDQATPADGNFAGIYGSVTATPEMFQRSQYGTVPRGAYAANPWGLYDVHGNVAEWTADMYWDRHPGGSAVDPHNHSRGRGRTVKGGSWRDSADAVRSAARSGLAEERGRNSVGFRVVLARPLPQD